MNATFIYHSRMDIDSTRQFTPIGYTTFRNEHKPFGIKLPDRFSHIYSIGKTGSGKTTLLLNMALDDIKKGHGVVLIEPHGDACKALLACMPTERMKDVVYFDTTDPRQCQGFNPLYNVPVDERHLVASEIVLSFKKIWGDSWGPRLEYILRYAILTLLEYPTATLLDIQPLLLDKGFRNLVLQFTNNGAILSFWHNEFDTYSQSLKTEIIMPILNKAGVFGAHTILRSIVGQQENINIEEIMNEGKILICNLSKGIIGDDVSQILGSLLTTAIQTTAMRRAKFLEQERKPFMVYIDECHSFISSSFAGMLSEVRKYKVGLYLTHQYMAQLPEEVRSGILGNVGTIICFRLGTADAKIMEDEFYPVFTVEDFVNLPRFHIYLKLLINGVGSKGFSAMVIKGLEDLI